ncbi:hypothetical protein SAMN05216525_14462 [Bradyrhizobium sp. Gha]|nr:hypothetical protein SAMN05216525_14462 [Bradyrhizobium sp. Gha]
MTIRSRRETVTFKHPFRIRGIERVLPAGAYEVVTDEETIEGLTFSAYRRIATMITVPAENRLRNDGDVVDRLDRSCERTSCGREYGP